MKKYTPVRYDNNAFHVYENIVDEKHTTLHEVVLAKFTTWDMAVMCATLATLIERKRNE